MDFQCIEALLELPEFRATGQQFPEDDKTQ